MRSVQRENAWLLILLTIAGAVLYHFGCRLLDANGYSRWACVGLLSVIVLVFVFLTAGGRRAVR